MWLVGATRLYLLHINGPHFQFIDEDFLYVFFNSGFIILSFITLRKYRDLKTKTTKFQSSCSIMISCLQNRGMDGYMLKTLHTELIRLCAVSTKTVIDIADCP